MTEEQAGAEMPDALKAILSEPGWRCDAEMWWCFDLDPETETRVQIFGYGGTFQRPYFHTDCFIIDADEMYRAADLMRRIEQALAAGQPDEEAGQE